VQTLNKCNELNEALSLIHKNEVCMHTRCMLNGCNHITWAKIVVMNA